MKKLLSLLLSTILLTACSNDDEPGPVPPQSIERTVIVYMAAENNLSSNVNADLKEMKQGSHQIGSGNALVVYVDKSNAQELPWLARIQDGQVVDSVSISDMGISSTDCLSSDPNVMEQVLQYAVRRYPATSDYGLVLWGHSTGWLFRDSVAYNRRAYGVDNGFNGSTNDGKWINIPAMARVLSNLPHFKFIFADCCNFMCLESLYELRSTTDYIIGSPAEVPFVGAPYQTVVPAMFSSTTDFYRGIVDRCFEQRVKGCNLPLSAVRTEQMEALAQATRTVLQAVDDSLKGEYADLSGNIYYFYNSLTMNYNPGHCIFYDAGDFIKRYTKPDDYRLWKEALDQAVVYKRSSTRWDTDKSWTYYYGDHFTVTDDRYHGVSMYVPQSSSLDLYATYSQDIMKTSWYWATKR